MIGSLVLIIAINVLAGVLGNQLNGFFIRFWSRCFPSPRRELMNIPLTECLFECTIRPNCMAIQYQRVQRACGFLTSSDIEVNKSNKCRSYVGMYRYATEADPPASCGSYKKSNLTGECITECQIPVNPLLYSTILGQTYVGNDIKVVCDDNFIQNRSIKSTCNKDGHFENLPRCESERDRNLALGRKTMQSSELLALRENITLSSINCVDGIKGGSMVGDPCFHTINEINPWFLVDLEHVYVVNKVDVYFRLDCCTERFESIYIFVSSNKTELVSNYQWDAGTFCDMYEGPPLHWERFITFHCQRNVQGRYVKISRTTNRTLEMCEVEIYGEVL